MQDVSSIQIEICLLCGSGSGIRRITAAFMRSCIEMEKLLISICVCVCVCYSRITPYALIIHHKCYASFVATASFRVKK